MTVTIKHDSGKFIKYLDVTDITHRDGWVYIMRNKKCLFQTGLALINIEVS